MFRVLAVAVALAAILPTNGAAAEREWYESYQDGVRALRAGRFQSAVEHLKRAANQRHEPGRDVRTYGTNLEPEYYPYLRLAEAYLGLRDASAALDALFVSDQFGVAPSEQRRRLRERAEALLEATRPASEPTPEPPPPPTVPAARVAPPEPTPEPRPSLEPTPASVPPASAPTPRPRPTRPAPATEPTRTTASPAILVIVSTPPGARVYVDDEPRGSTDPVSGRLVLRDLPAGPHGLRLSSEGHRDTHQAVELVAGQELVAQVALAAQAPAATPPPTPAEPAAQDRSGDVVLALVVLVALAVSAWAVRLLLRPVPGTDLGLARDTPGPRAAASRAGEHATPTPEVLPQRFGEYVLIERLGRGGMAVVYRAEHHGEFVALKRPLSSIAEDEQALERFLREAAIGRTLYHPNIVRVLETGEVEGAPYFTMELVEGETLHARLRREGALAPRAAAWLVGQVAEALDYAHSKGVVHRDLKPSNILLPVQGPPKVGDYGIARARRFEGLTATGAFLGSPEYVPPEVVEGRPADGRSDLYSLGVVFFEALTGERPFSAETPFAVLQSHLTQAPRPPSALAAGVPPVLDEMVLRLLAKRPEDRYADAEALLRALTDHLNRARDTQAGEGGRGGA